MRGFRSLSLVPLAFAWSTAGAVHLDVELKGSGDGLAVGFCMTQGVGCDLPGALGKLGLPAGTLPADGASGERIFAADFADFPKPYDTANPGFHATPGALRSGELIRYRALGALAYWDPSAKAWAAPPADVRIRLFGGLDAKTVVTLDYSQCGGLLVCIPKEKLETVYEEGSTVFSGTGIAGAESLLIDNASSQGSLHTHLDWFLETASGTKGGPAGAYLVRLQLVSDQRPQASPTFLIAFNNGLSDEGFADAIAARMAAVPAPQPDPVPDPTPDPAPQPDPVPNPDPVPVPVSDPVPEQEFLSFKYRETATEALAGCRPKCRKTLRGTVAVDARISLEGDAAVEAVRTASAAVLNLGTTAFRTELGQALAGAAAKAGGIRLPVTNDGNSPIGKLRLQWKGGRLMARYTLAATAFANDFLEDKLGRGDRLETFTLQLRDAAGTPLLAVKTVLEIGGKTTRRQVVRGKANYALGTARLSSRRQTR